VKNPDLQLRPLQTSDKFQIARLANNKKIWDNVRDGFGHPYTLDNAAEFIQWQARSNFEKVFAIDSNGEICGLVGLILQKDIYRKSAEIGYWVGEPFWGQGIATAAVGKVVRVAFDDLKLARVYAGAFEYNRGSMRVLEKNGFVKEGIAKKAVFKNDKFWDEHRYALLNTY
jgi:RimJ/RimL family protein N-acetyltransferase